MSQKPVVCDGDVKQIEAITFPQPSTRS